MKVTIRPEVDTASGRREGWVKRVTAIGKGAGAKQYAGDYLRPGAEVELPVGAVLLRVDPRGSARRGWQEATVWLVSVDGLCQHGGDELDWRDDAVSVRRLVADALEVGVPSQKRRQVGPEPGRWGRVYVRRGDEWDYVEAWVPDGPRSAWSDGAAPDGAGPVVLTEHTHDGQHWELIQDGPRPTSLTLRRDGVNPLALADEAVTRIAWPLMCWIRRLSVGSNEKK